MKRICVYCASSDAIDPSFHANAFTLGEHLAEAGLEIVYGGGGRGSMGALANGALKGGGSVIGILPRFMADLEWGHPGLTHLELVEDMRERKHRMLVDADAVVTLPGGCGTFEELFEAMTLKRLGIYLGPIVLVNTNQYYDPLVEVLDQAVRHRFMGDIHRRMWQMAEHPGEVLDLIRRAAPWTHEHRNQAVQQ